MAPPIEAFKERLSAERDRLEKEIALLVQEQLAGTDEPDSEAGDEGADTFERTKSLAMQQDLKLLLSEIDHALDKARMGTYGKCDDCGAAIPLERLEALPYAALCVNCKRNAERASEARHRH